MDVRQRGPEGVQADVGIRGASFDQTLLLLNGMKLNDPQTGHHMFNLPLPAEAVERMEVIRNSASRLYGINALAGAINLVTKVPEGDRLFLGAEGGDFKLYGINAGLSLHKGGYAQFTSVSHRSSEGYLPNTDFRITQAFHQSVITLGKSVLDLYSGYSDRSFGARGFYVPNPEEYESVQTAFNGVRLRTIAGKWTFTGQTYHRYNQDHYIYIRSKPEIFQNRHFAHTGGIEFNGMYKSRLGETGIGIDSRTEKLSSSNLGKRERMLLGMYAEHRFGLMQGKLTLTPGAYVNLMLPDKFMCFPGIDVRYAASRKLLIHASADRGMRLPTYTDLYYAGPLNTGNPDLKPETAVSAEAGMQTSLRRLLFSFKGFYRKSDDLIDWARQSPADKWQPLNLNKVTVLGTETSFDIRFSGIIERFRISHTYLHAETGQPEQYLSRYSLSNLKHQATGVLIIRYSSKWSQTFSVRHLNRVTQTDYTLIDSKLMYRNRQFFGWAEVTNLSDESYSEAGFALMSGRWFRVGISLNIGLKRKQAP